MAIDWLETPTLLALNRQLRQADYHVLHYIGHGAYDHDADDGVLLFGDDLAVPGGSPASNWEQSCRAKPPSG